MRENINIDLVLLMTEDKTSMELGPALWAAFKEVEQFYNFGRNRANFRFLRLSDSVPRGREKSFKSQLWNFLFGRKKESGFSVEQVSLEKPVTEQLKGARGRYSKTVDSLKIVELVGDMIAEKEFRAKIIVIDKELTPPRDWRYVIWYNRVISTLPTDPLYWGIDDPYRIAVIKHRVRTACLSNVGSLIGLGRCLNENCFLYRNVDSVIRLDWMVKLGSEHKVVELENHGFDTKSDDPAAIQSIVVDPVPRR